MAKVPYGVETLPKISIVWVGRTNVTDRRQTTDGRTMTYSEHELEFTFAKNDNDCTSGNTIYDIILLRKLLERNLNNVESYRR